MNTRAPLPPALVAGARSVGAQSVIPTHPADLLPPRSFDPPTLTPNPNPAVPPAARIHDDIPPGATPVDASTFHHDVIELPETEQVEFAVLDPWRISYGSLVESLTLVFGLDDAEDRNHGNAIVFDQRNDAYVDSTRHQEAAVRFGRDLQIHWILGVHDGWRAPWDQDLLTPVGSPFGWSYHQHAPEITSRGTTLAYDDGSGRAVAPAREMSEGQRSSRAVEVRRTVELVRAWGGGSDEQFSSPSLCDADELPVTGNVWMADGDRDSATGPGFSRIAELTRTLLSQRVFEFVLHDPTPVMPETWTTYRAEQLSGVYAHP